MARQRLTKTRADAARQRLTKTRADAARQRLTKTRADTARPEPGRQTFLWCTDLPRFGLRTSATGRRTFVIQYRDAADRSRRYTIGPYGSLTVEQARAETKRLLAEIALGGDPAAARQTDRQAPSLGALCDRYLEEHARVHMRTGSVRADELNIKNTSALPSVLSWSGRSPRSTSRTFTRPCEPPPSRPTAICRS